MQVEASDLDIGELNTDICCLKFVTFHADANRVGVSLDLQWHRVWVNVFCIRGAGLWHTVFLELVKTSLSWQKHNVDECTVYELLDDFPDKGASFQQCIQLAYGRAVWWHQCKARCLSNTLLLSTAFSETLKT